MRFLMSVAAMALPFSAPAVAQAPDHAALFAARPRVEHASLSPDGTQVAFVAPTKGQGAIIKIVQVEGDDKLKAAAHADGKPERLGGCNWVAEDRLVCRTYAVAKTDIGVVSVNRVVAVDTDGKGMQVLTKSNRMASQLYNLNGGQVLDWLPSENGQILMARRSVIEDLRQTKIVQSLGVDKIDTRTGDATRIEPPSEKADLYISDGQGNVRVMGTVSAGLSGYTKDETNYFFRRKGSRQWEPLGASGAAIQADIQPAAVDSNLDVAYLWRKQDGRWALFSRKLDGSASEQLVFAHPKVDVDNLIHIGRSDRVVGATYVTDSRQYHYFDPATAQMARALSKALPGKLIRIADSSANEGRLLIWAGSDVDPGIYYIYDKARKALNALLPLRPELDGMPLSPMKAITYKATDGTEIPAYLTLPPGATSAKGLPAIVMPHGGPAARDEWGFDWMTQFYAQSGYAVLQPNYRGSTGYGENWMQENGYKSWRTSIGDVADAGRWLVAEGADPGKLTIVGWSYGGYAALLAAATEPDLFKAVVAVAPVTDLAMLKSESQYYANHRINQQYIGSGPHIEEGSPARNAEKIKAPVLIFHGTLDSNVGVGQSTLMASRLKRDGKQHKLVQFEGLDHHLEDSTAREQMLRESDAWLKAAFKS